MWRSFVFLLGALTACAHTPSVQAQTPCDGPEAADTGTAAQTSAAVKPAVATTASEGFITVSPVPLPGKKAPDFELTALIGEKVTKLKLSDYAGKWLVVCFYPADFTFV